MTATFDAITTAAAVTITIDTVVTAITVRDCDAVTADVDICQPLLLAAVSAAAAAGGTQSAIWQVIIDELTRISVK